MNEIQTLRDEELRLEELARYRVILEEKEEVFCELAQLAMLIAKMPFGGVSLVDREHVWLKGRVGVELSCLQREGAFCSHAVESNDELFIVEDASIDSRFSTNPIVIDAPYIRHYSAANLISHRGYRLGTLWVMDTQPRSLPDKAGDAMLGLAAQVVRILELRYENTLTRLANRSAFVSNLQCALNQQRGSHVCRIADCARKDESGSCLSEWREEQCVIGYIRLQNISLINSAYGREAGDALLLSLSKELRNWVGPRNLLGHVETDHFAFALFKGNTEIEAQLQALTDLLGKPVISDGDAFRLSVTIGLSHFPDSGRNASSLLDQASVAAMQTIDVGPVVINQLANKTRDDMFQVLELQTQLANHIRHDRVVPYYQPQIDVRSGCVVGFEALARLRHPRLGLLLPKQFIPLAEQSGLIRELDLHMLRSICADLARWRSLGYEVLPVAANFSRSTLMESGTPQHLLSIVEEYSISPDLIEVEITESGFTEHPKVIGKHVEAIRALGFSVSVDDFGTGLSNLGTLRDIRFDRLKADRQYVHGASANLHIGGILRLIKGISDLFEVDMICEGIEDFNDLKWISSLGCRHFQGWLFSRELAPEAVPILFDRLARFYKCGQYKENGPMSLVACLHG